MSKRVLAGVLVAGALAAPAPAEAFCGFYVGGADAKLYNNATLVVLMREGQRTVLSMQNDYQGPPEGFAMVVPVPVVLKKENVKTLDRAVFERVDRLSAPRLVEYWEQDPCAPPPAPSGRRVLISESSAQMPSAGHGVKIEARFQVAEYDVVVLSARDSMGLDRWLRQEKYAIPENAEPVLKPYVQQGSKFFVAKVDPKKVRFEGGRAVLSPLRFHYDSKDFTLPVRLGLINSSGTQDLLVHVLAKGQRYEVANYPNVTIPTNLEVQPEAKDRFGQFYAALFDKVLEKNPGAVVTEYAWGAASCDPCPGPVLGPEDLVTLGADVLPSAEKALAKPAPGPTPVMWNLAQGFVLTRLHARYAKHSLGEDLVLEEAPPIEGGREVWVEPGRLEQGARPAGFPNFQGRYIIRHEWKGPIECENPIRGVWGGPHGSGGPAGATPALDLALAPRGAVQLGALLAKDLSELGIVAERRGAGAAPAGPAAPPTAPPSPPPPPQEPPGAGGCGSCSIGTTGAGAVGAGFALLALLIAARRRRR